MGTPLIDRIEARKPRTEPVPLKERMSEFSRRLAEKRLPVKEYGAWTPSGSDGAA